MLVPNGPRDNAVITGYTPRLRALDGLAKELRSAGDDAESELEVGHVTASDIVGAHLMLADLDDRRSWYYDHSTEP